VFDTLDTTRKAKHLAKDPRVANPPTIVEFDRAQRRPRDPRLRLPGRGASFAAGSRGGPRAGRQL